MLLGIDPMRLYEIEVWHPGMLDSLVRAHRERWTRTDERLAHLSELVHLVYRQLFMLAGGSEEPDPLRILRPGQEPPKPKWVQQMSGLAGATEGG